MEPLAVLIGVCRAGLLALVALLVVLIAHARRRERARQQTFRDWAVHHGWTYVPAAAVDWERDYQAATATECPMS